MSKTIRRKNHRPKWLYTESGFKKVYYYQYRGIKFNSKKYKKLIAIYHSDGEKIMNAPKWFRKTLNQDFRNKNKMILKKCQMHDIEPVFVKYRKNANWLWW